MPLLESIYGSCGAKQHPQSAVPVQYSYAYTHNNRLAPINCPQRQILATPPSLPLSLTLQYAHRTSFHLGNNEQVKEAGWISAATMQWVGPPSSAAGLLPLPHSLPPITLHDNNPIWCPSRPRRRRRLRLIDTQKGFSKLLPPHHIHNTISSEILPPPFPSLPSSQLDTRAANLKFELVNSRCNPGQVGSL